MPVEAATDSPENRCPVRRSGRQPKRTDKLEEFLLTAKRGSRKSAPPSLESGDPPSQTPTDAETASEASFDGSADFKTVEDKVESPERRTRSSTRKQTQQTQERRQTRSSGRLTVKDEGSSENEEDSKVALKKDSLQEDHEKNKDGKEDHKLDKVRSNNAAQTQTEKDPEEKVVPEVSQSVAKNEKDKMEKTDEDSLDTSLQMPGNRRPVRTYINKMKVAKKNTTLVKSPAPANKNTAAKETKTKIIKASGKVSKPDTEEEDDDSCTSSSSSNESDNGGYDPNALYCICRQKHNKR